MLDFAVINAHILYGAVTGSKVSRRRFIIELTEEILTRFQHDGQTISCVAPPVNSRKHKCQVALCKGNRAISKCGNCDKLACGQCTHIREVICRKCSQ